MKKSKNEKNYYAEIDTALKSFETFKPYHPHSIEWVCDRITWAWKFRKISKSQMEELTDRACKVLKM